MDVGYCKLIRWDNTIARILDFLNRQFALNDSKLDCIVWKLKKHGTFNVKNVLQTLIQPQVRVNWARMVWSASKKLRTRDKLFQWRISKFDTCILCNSTREEIEYLFFKCSFSRAVLIKVLWAIKMQRRPLAWNREISWFTRKQMENL